MTTFTQITAKFDEVKRTVRLRVHVEDQTTLRGFEVDREGADVTRKGAHVYYIIAKSDILKQVALQMNNHYGELEPIKN